ncbi:MAG: pitrilysin family protein [Chloroflexota bacterium]
MVAADFEKTLPSSQNITRVELENGLIVLVFEKPDVQSVVVTGSMPAGSANDTPETAGLAAMTAEATTRGTANRDFDALHTELEMLGADFDVDGGRFKTGFGGKALAEDLPTLVDIMNDVLRNPTFPEQQVERLRGEVLTTLNYYQQDTRYRARRAFYEALYPDGNPLHYSSSGTIETISSLTVANLREFHSSYFGPQGTVVVIVGNVKADDAVDIVRGKMSDWQNPNQQGMAAIPDAPTIAEAQRVFTPVAGKTQSDLIMGFVGPNRHADDYHAARLANAVLGQFGMMGRIGTVVREEKGYAYYSRSGLDGGYANGAWSAFAGIKPENVEETIEDITHEFKRISTEAVTDEDLDNVQSYFTGSLPLGLESNEGVASTILRMEGYNLGLDYLLGYRDMIWSLTKDDLLQAAANYINVDKLTISVAGPEKGL